MRKQLNIVVTKTLLFQIQQNADLQIKERQLSHMFEALSDSGRFKIFKILLSHQDLCVSDLANICNISIPAASQQLKILERSNLIQKERHGRRICYIIERRSTVVHMIIKLITQHVS